MNISIKKEIKSIRSQLSRAMIRDRNVISEKLTKLRRMADNRQESKKQDIQLNAVKKRLNTSIRIRSQRLAKLPEVSIPSHLPISSKADEIINAIRNHQVVIIAGDTGSGKSTQIPKMCLMAGQGVSGLIGCTQPRRLAAITIARRIAEEMGEDVGKSVGYKIRFNEKINKKGYVKIMTDGMLLAETQEDQYLNEYDTIIIDEAHERSLNIDFLLGILRTLLNKRKDLKVIVTSATMDTEKFSKGFGNAPVITVHGRMYPVDVRYMPPDKRQEERGDITYVDNAVKAVEKLVNEGSKGDMLIFMPTEQDILETCELLESQQFSGVTVLPLFARLSSKQQHRVFASMPGRKIVVATNVAETSLTIPGIRYVIDTGLARISRYLPRTRITSLPISPVSISSSDQRKGRCGRVADGICVRLYSEEDYENRDKFTSPEVLRANLAEVILRMMALNLGDIHAFPFLDEPDPKSIKDGIDLLKELGAIERKDRKINLTDMGRIMSRMPLDPKISRMLIESRKEGCIKEISVIASALSIQDPKVRPLDQAGAADRKHAPFKDQDSDFISLLNIWNRYHRNLKDQKTQNRMRRYCRENFLSYLRMREWGHIHGQITTILKEQKLGADKAVKKRKGKEILYDGIHRAILSGYLSNIALKKDKNIYQAARNREAMIFPGSTLFGKSPQWIVAAEMVKTSRLFARTAAKIDSEWLEALGNDLCKYSYSDPRWEKNRGSVIASEQVSLYGLVIVQKRPVQYGRIDPGVSHEIFIRSALVNGEVKGSFDFIKHNRTLAEKIAGMEDKVRRRNILMSEDRIAEFYSENLEGIVDTAGLKRLIRERGTDKFLNLTEGDLLLSEPDKGELSQFPDGLTIGDRFYDLSYKFAPGEQDDGVTVRIPSSLVSRVETDALDWLVPGLLKDKIFALIKGLPKRYRKQLVPVSEKVEIIDAEMEKEGTSLVNILGRFIYRRFNVDIPASAWPLEEINDHLRMRIAITDHHGKEVKSGRDIGLLKQGVPPEMTGEEDAGAWKKARKEWEKSGLKPRDFGELPGKITLGPHLVAYPGLVSDGEDVSIRLFNRQEEAELEHRKGVAELFKKYLRQDLKLVKKSMVVPKDLHKAATYLGGHKKLDKALYNAFINKLFCLDIRTKEAFEAHAVSVRPGIFKEERELLGLTVKVLDSYEEVRTGIDAIETKNRSNIAVLSLFQLIRIDLNRLVPQDFLEKYQSDRLKHIPRYLKALLIRAQRGVVDLLKDEKKEAQIEPFEKAFQGMCENMSIHASTEKMTAVDDFGWMIEEFRVNLFAQELGTPFPVSAKRLNKKMEEIERMV